MQLFHLLYSISLSFHYLRSIASASVLLNTVITGYEPQPDLGITVTFLSRYLHKLGVKDMHAAKHTPRYLKGTKGLGIQYTRDHDCLSARDQKLNIVYALSDRILLDAKTQLNLHLDT